MRPSNKRLEDHARIEADVEAWIAEHGAPPVFDHTANKTWREKEKKWTSRVRAKNSFSIRHSQ